VTQLLVRTLKYLWLIIEYHSSQLDGLAQGPFWSVWVPERRESPLPSCIKLKLRFVPGRPGKQRALVDEVRVSLELIGRFDVFNEEPDTAGQAQEENVQVTLSFSPTSAGRHPGILDQDSKL